MKANHQNSVIQQNNLQALMQVLDFCYFVEFETCNYFAACTSAVRFLYVVAVCYC